MRKVDNDQAGAYIAIGYVSANALTPKKMASSAPIKDYFFMCKTVIDFCVFS